MAKTIGTVTIGERKIGDITFTDALDTGVDKTITFNLDETVNHNPDYHFLGDYLQNPINDKIIHIYNNGAGHLWDVDKKVSAVLSTDSGITRGAEYDVYDPGGVYGVGSFTAGYDSTGKLHIFVSKRDSATAPATTIFEYMTSTDDGVTVTAPVTLTQPSDGLQHIWAYGTMIENNGVLMVPFYRITDIGDFTNSANYILRSTDGGANWTNVTMRSSSNPYYNETSIVAISSTEILAMTRNETDTCYRQFFSDDNGLTWADHGSVDFNETWPLARPCCLRAFDINGIKIIACYYYKSNESKTKVIYGKADNLKYGSTGWDTSTTLDLLTGLTGGGGYGTVVHFNNTLEAVGLHYEDWGLTYTKSFYYTQPTTHHDSLATALTGAATGLLTNVYDSFEFDEASGTVVNSVHTDRNATKTGTPTQSATGGVIDGHIDLDSTGDFLTYGTTSSHKFMHYGTDGTDISWTAEFWIKFPSTPGDLDTSNIFIDSNGTSGGNKGVSIRFDDRSGSSRDRRLYASITNGGGKLVDLVTVDGFFPNDTGWHQIVVTYDHTLSINNMTIYTDGVYGVSATKSALIPSNTNASYIMNIGHLSTGGTTFDLRAKMDMLRIWKRTFTGKEVNTLYNSGSGVAYSSFT